MKLKDTIKIGREKGKGRKGEEGKGGCSKVIINERVP